VFGPSARGTVESPSYAKEACERGRSTAAHHVRRRDAKLLDYIGSRRAAGGEASGLAAARGSRVSERRTLRQSPRDAGRLPRRGRKEIVIEEFLEAKSCRCWR